MTSGIVPKLVAAAAVLVALGSSGWAQSTPTGSSTLSARTGSGAGLQVCLAKADGSVSDVCGRPASLSMRMDMGPRGTMRAKTTMQFTHGGLQFMRAVAAADGTGDGVRVCIVEGANICPPEPFELVWACITTGMLAGEECPAPPEDTVGPTYSLQLNTGRRPGS